MMIPLFALCMCALAAEDMMFGGVRRGLLAGAFSVPLALALAAKRSALAYCASAMIVFIVVGKIARGGREKALGEADIFAAGIIALFTGTLWPAGICFGACICGVYCAVSKKRCVPFIPFLCAGTAVSLILSGMGLGYCDGGLL